MKHFERQIEKLDYHHQQMNEAEEFGKTASKGKISIHEKLTTESRQNYEKMYRKIKKLNHYLDEKLSNIRSEL